MKNTRALCCGFYSSPGLSSVIQAGTIQAGTTQAGTMLHLDSGLKVKYNKLAIFGGALRVHSMAEDN
jgi:hypothetical protein